MRINCKRPTCGKAICLLNFQKGDLRDSGNIKWRENSSVFQIGHKTPNPNHVDKNCNKKSDNPTHKILKVTEPVFLPEQLKIGTKICNIEVQTLRGWAAQDYGTWDQGTESRASILHQPKLCSKQLWRKLCETKNVVAVLSWESGWRYLGVAGSAGNERISDEDPNTVGGVGGWRVKVFS